MTVQQLIDELSKVEDKSKEVLHYDFGGIECIDDKDEYIVIY